MILRISELMWK